MSEKYGYLKQFLPPHPQYEGTNRNWFFPVTEEEIRLAEQKLKIKFPDQLRTFYQEIGYGSLYAPHNALEGYIAYNTNQILSPTIIIDIMTLGHESDYITEDTYELLSPDDLVFFEVDKASSFLTMKPNSDNANAVWALGNIKLEDSFERFIWRLYYESPWFYEEIAEEQFNNLLSSLAPSIN